MKESLQKIDKPLYILTLILLTVGLIMVFSSSNIAAVLQYKYTASHFFVRQLAVILVGLFIVFPIVITNHTEKYNFLSIILIVGIIGTMIALRIHGITTNNARSWFPIFGFSFQPSEFSKTVIILYLACIYGVNRKWKNNLNILIPLIPTVIIFGLIVLEPDLGTAMIVLAIVTTIFYSLPFTKTKEIKILRLLGIVGFISMILLLQNTENISFLREHQKQRLTFKNPCERYLEDTGYQVCNGYIAINNGGLLGAGLSKSTQKYLYLPEAHTDFIFPIIVEELGLIGGSLILVLQILVLYRILVIAKHAKNLRGSIIAIGTFAYILSHIIVNIGGLLALIPLTGVPLPFMSYGGSFMLNLIILISLTQRVAIESKTKVGKKI